MARRDDRSAFQDKEQHLQALLLKGLGGDASAYRAFLDRLSSHLRAFLRRRLASRPHDVEDLVQEVLLAVHNARDSYRPTQPVSAWVQAIARYKLVDHFRAYARQDALHDPIDASIDLLASEDSDGAESSRDLDSLLSRLPDKQRLPIVHVKLEGHSVADTARMTGLSESAVKIGIHRGLKALASIIRGKS
ncbi:sigma-70 family RNA polymerase sigma factor [Robbsia sp. KACC 23696]|uniref:sigma-70 family RNA polymerase sigma factor n=1 Tax=Robbsia sp. KACC 23696 TaxID=3149231 RepID=UPI00325A6D3B